MPKKRTIKPWKGGRTEHLYARAKPDTKKRLLERVKREGYKSFADWLEAQSMK
jgi:predicted transcriptional regulator